MLTVLYGNDYEKLRKHLNQVLGKDTPEYISPDTFDEGKLAQLAQGTGLFDTKETLVFSGLFSDKETWQRLKNYLGDLVSSPNQFIVVEEKMLKKDLQPFEKAEATIVSFALPKKKNTDEFNVFVLSDSLGNRDKKKLWLTYYRALQVNKTPEEVHGILWWQVKNMLTVAKTGKNPGLHPFVFGKTEKALKKYQKEEIEQLGKKLVIAFHEARRGRADLGRETEKIILAL